MNAESFSAESDNFSWCAYCDDLITDDYYFTDGKKVHVDCNLKDSWDAEETYDCGCDAELVEYSSGHSQYEYDGVQCSSCGYNSCLDCHHINSQSANHKEWKCYEGYGCNKDGKNAESFSADSKFKEPYMKGGKLDMKRGNDGKFRRRLVVPLEKNQ
jgi:hypothetical protein